MDKRYGAAKLYCYSINISMAITSALPPLLFLMFRSSYGVSYSLLGLLVLINFCTQLFIDLIFSFFSHKFNITLTVKMMPFITAVGYIIYGLSPWLFASNVYVGLVIGTVIFSASAGLAEVLISPVIAAIPSDDPDREMSKLHSVFAWGVVFVVAVSTAFFVLFPGVSWQYLVLFFALVPVVSVVISFYSRIPEMKTPEKTSGAVRISRNKEMILCFFCIFLGGACECTMSQWSSGYLEQVFGLPKMWGDMLGVALFAIMLGLGRSAYAKFGKKIHKVLLVGAVGALVCYFTAVFSGIPAIGLAACAVTGLCVSMMWPGSLIVAADRIPEGGVAVYALMAAGGDFGASVGPQLVGIITDMAAKNEFCLSLAEKYGLTVDQISLRIGMLVATAFPLAAVIVFSILYRTEKKRIGVEKC